MLPSRYSDHEEPNQPLSTSQVVAWLILTVVFGSALQLYLVHKGLLAISWDGSARTVVAYKWMLDKYLFRPSAWLPFHRLLVGLTLEFWRDLIVAPRSLSFAFGILSIGSVFWLSWEIFADTRRAIVAAFLAAILADRLVLGVVPLSSIIFAAVTIPGLTLAARWHRTREPSLLFLAASVFGLSTTIRYEGWLIAGTFLAVAGAKIIHGRSRREYLALSVGAVAAISFPVLWIGMHALHTGQPLGFLDAGSTPYPIRTALNKNPLTQFIKHGLRTGVIVGLVPLAIRLRRGEESLRFLTLVAFLPLAVLSATLLVNSRAQSGPSWRMVCVWLLVLTPLAADLICAASRARRAPLRIAGIGLAAALLLASLTLADQIRQRSAWYFPQSDRALGSFLATYLGQQPNTKILIDSRRSWYLNVLVASQRPDAFIPNEGIPGTDRPQILSPSDSWQASQADERGIGLLVFRSSDYVSSLTRDPALQRVGRYGAWVVFEVSPAES